MKLFKLEVSDYICELLYQNSKHAVFSHLISVSFLLFLLKDLTTSGTLVLWASLFYVAIFLKGYVSWLYFKEPHPQRNKDRAYLWFLLTTFFLGSVWATAVFGLFPEDNIKYQFLLILTAIGMAGVSALTQSVDKLAILLFSQPVFIAVTLRLLMVDDHLYKAMAGILIFLDAPLVIAALNSGKVSFKLYESADIERKMNAAKTEFLANMSHEIRTPMNAVVGLGYLLEKTTLNDQQQHYVSKLQRASNSLLGIINRILDFSRIEAGQMELEHTSFDLHDVMQTVTAHVETQAEKKNLSFDIKIANNVKTKLIGDPLRLGQILTNLSANGIKFTEHGGVKVQVDRLAINENRICLIFRVEDTGSGIREADQEKLFESFTQLNASDSRKYGGTGLGLAISQRLLAMMNSKIQIESQLGQGTTFFFAIWFDEGSNEQENSSAVKIQPKESTDIILSDLPELKGKKVLLVDDDELNRDIGKEILSIFGLEVILANSAKDSFIKLSEDRPDLIFMDLQMPKMTGYEALDVIHANPDWEDIPVIALTANARVVERRKALAYGMDDFLTKPIDPQEVKQKLLEWIPHNTNKSITPEDRKRATVSQQQSNSEAEVTDKLNNVIDMLGSKSAIRFFKKIDKAINKEEPELLRILHSHNWPEAAKLAHRLKGSLNLYGSSELESLLNRINNQAVASDDTENVCNALQAEFQIIQTMLREHH